MTEGQHKAAAVIEGRVDSLDRELNKATKRINKMQAALEKAQGAADKKSASLNRIESSTTSLTGRMDKLVMGLGVAGLAGALVAGTKTAIDMARSLGALADESIRVQNVFRNQQISIDAVRASTRGMVSDFDLVRLSSDALSLKVSETSRGFADLAEAAVKLGARKGEGPVESIESLIGAVGRASPALLDNLGITLKMREAQEAYAKKLGVTVKQLDDNQRAEAFRKIAIERIIEAAQDVTLTTDGAAAAVQRFNVELDNVKNAALGGEVQTISLGEGLRKLAQTMDLSNEKVLDHNAAVEEVKDALRELGVAYEDVNKPATEWVALLEHAMLVESSRQKQLKLDALAQKARGQAFQEAADAFIAADKAVENINITQRVRAIQLEIAALDGSSRAREHINDLQAEQVDLTARQLTLEGKLAEAEKVRFQEQLRLLRAEGKRGGGGRGRQLSPEERQLEDLFGRGGAKRSEKLLKDIERRRALEEEDGGLQSVLDAADKRATPDPFDLEAFRAKKALAKQENEELVATERAKNDMLLAEKLRAVEVDRDANVDPFQLIENEKAARIAHNEFLLENAEGEAEQLRILDDNRQIVHEANMRRLEAEKRGEEERIRIIQKAVKIGEKAANTAVMGLVSVSDARFMAREAALAEGKGHQEAARAAEAAGLQAQAAQGFRIRNELIAFGIQQTAMGIGTLFVNPPESASHFAAAALAATGAVVAGQVAKGRHVQGLRAGASGGGGFGGGGFGGGGSFGPSVPTINNEGRAANGPGGQGESIGSQIDSEIPGSPSPHAPSVHKPQQQLGAGGIQFNGPVHLYGIPEEDFVRSIDRGLRDLGFTNRRASA